MASSPQWCSCGAGFLHFIGKEADRTALAPRVDSRRWGWLATADAPP
jgi:hypothetical protein